MNLGLIALIVLVALGVAGAIGAHLHFENKRREKIAQIAESLGLSFNPNDDAALRERFSSFKIFSQGHSRKAKNCLSGDSGEVAISIFDYSYTTGSGKNQSTKTLTLVGMESSSLRVPSFVMRPENLFDKLGSMMGFQDIDFEDDQVFSSQFVLQSNDEAGVRKLFSPELRSYFSRFPSANVEVGRGKMVFSKTGSRASAEEYQELLATAYELFGLLVDRKPA